MTVLSAPANKIFFRTMVLVIFLGVAIPGSGLAASQDPLSEMKGAVEEILRILKDKDLQVPEKKEERRSRVVAVVETIFDFQAMSQYVLADSWKERTPEEQREFVDLFARMVKQRYIGKIDNYSGQEVVFKKQLVKDDRGLIYSSLVDKGVEIPIIYKLFRKDESWRVFDMTIENVSLIANYRQDFNSIIKKDGYSELVKRLQEKMSEFEAGGK